MERPCGYGQVCKREQDTKACLVLVVCSVVHVALLRRGLSSLGVVDSDEAGDPGDLDFGDGRAVCLEDGGLRDRRADLGSEGRRLGMSGQMSAGRPPGVVWHQETKGWYLCSAVSEVDAGPGASGRRWYAVSDGFQKRAGQGVGGRARRWVMLPRRLGHI